MSLTLKLFKFSKRQNSTAVPVPTSGTDVSIDLKDQTQILTPTFILHWTSYPDYNYAEFMGRYYFISTIESIRNDIWALSCSVDLLATYKANILATSAYVEFDTTANTEITDSRLSTVTTPTRAENVGSAFDYIGTGYCVVVNVVGESNCCTYIMDINDALGLLDTISTWNATTIPNNTITPGSAGFDSVEEALESLHDMLESVGENITDRLIKGFRQIISSDSAASCIKSAFILPIAANRISGTSGQNVELGLFTSTKTGTQRTSRGIQDVSTVAIPWQASDWRRNAPYHEIYLYIPFIGVVSYPASALIGATNLTVQVAIDETAGDCLVTVSTSPTSGGAANHVIGQYSTNIAANYAIGSSNITPRQLATSIMATAGVVATSAIAPPAGVLAGAAGITAELNAATPVPSSVGGAGGGAVLALFGYACRCMSIFHNTNVSPDSVSAIIGTPAKAVKSLATLTGYVETRCASVSGAMLESERTQINQLLDGGVYIE